MRGILRISSLRSPYLRAGLSWPERVPIEVDIRTLDAPRFLELVRDPVLSISIGQADNTFRPMPAMAEDITEEIAQMMIDSLCAELGELPAEPAPTGDDASGALREQLANQAALIEAQGEKLSAFDGLLADRGHDSLEALLDSHDRIAGVLEPIQALAGEYGLEKEQTTADWIRGLITERDELTHKLAAAAAAPDPAKAPGKTAKAKPAS